LTCCGQNANTLKQTKLLVDIKLSAEGLRRLEEVFPKWAAAGQRYPEHMMAMVKG
jgi:hypothetical protein